MDKFEKFQSRYESGEVPWDHELPPPELIALAEELPPGRVLDMGCGYGRTCIYLAQRGWLADGIDFVPLAIEEAKRRAVRTAVSQHIIFLHGSVTSIPYENERYDLIVDVGCMHALSDEELVQYRGEVERLLREDGRYLLFAHVRDDGDDSDESKGVPEAAIRTLFANFTLEHVEYGTTQVEDKPPWNSAWFWYRKQS